jgi:hypothetical protein
MHERRQSDCPQLAAEPSGPAAAVLAADDDERSTRGERAPEPSQRRVASDIEDQVIALAAGREVVVGVVNDMVGSDRPDELELCGAGDAGDLRSEGPGDLYREGADASGRADDQYVLFRFDVPSVGQALEGGESGDGDGCALIEGEVRGLARELVLAGARVLGE